VLTKRKDRLYIRVRWVLLPLGQIPPITLRLDVVKGQDAVVVASTLHAAFSVPLAVQALTRFFGRSTARIPISGIAKLNPVSELRKKLEFS
jgi:hypothetical protein